MRVDYSDCIGCSAGVRARVGRQCWMAGGQEGRQAGWRREGTALVGGRASKRSGGQAGWWAECSARSAEQTATRRGKRARGNSYCGDR